MTKGSSDRLDRIENDFEIVTDILLTVARQCEASEKRMQATDDRIDRLAQRQDRTQVQLDQLGVKVD